PSAARPPPSVASGGWSIAIPPGVGRTRPGARPTVPPVPRAGRSASRPAPAAPPAGRAAAGAASVAGPVPGRPGRTGRTQGGRQVAAGASPRGEGGRRKCQGGRRLRRREGQQREARDRARRTAAIMGITSAAAGWFLDAGRPGTPRTTAGKCPGPAGWAPVRPPGLASPPRPPPSPRPSRSPRARRQRSPPASWSPPPTGRAAPRHALRQAPVDEFVVEGRVRFLPGRFEVPPGPLRVAGAAVEFAERRIEQVIVPQGRVPAGLVQRPDARVWAVDLGHDNRPGEQVHPRAP